MVGLVGLNSTGGFPSLQNPFAPLNQLALQQQAAGSGFTPAYASPVQLPPNETPDAGGALSALQFQMGPNQNRPQLGVTPNSASPPVQGDAAVDPQSGQANGAAAPRWPPAWPDLVHALSQVGAGLGGDLSNIGPAVSNGVYDVGRAVAAPLVQVLGLLGAHVPAAPLGSGPVGILMPPPTASTGRGLLG